MIYIIFLFSIIIHEVSHLLMAKVFNIRISKLKFKILGISAEFEEKNKMQYSRKVLIVLIGPVLNLLISLFCLNFKFDFTYKKEIIYTNFILFIFNLLPVIPLDGGNLLFFMLNLKYDFEKSFRIIRFISKCILSILTITYSFAIFIIENVYIFILIVYLWYIFLKEENGFELYIKINKNMIKYLNLQKKCAKIPSVIK